MPDEQDPQDNVVTLLAMVVPLPGAEDEAKRRWVALLEELGVPGARRLVLAQMGLWPQALEAIKRGHTIQSLAKAVAELEENDGQAELEEELEELEADAAGS